MSNSGVKIGFHFVPLPQEIWDKNLKLSLGEFRLLGYITRHQVNFGNERVRLTDDELLKGRKRKGGERMDTGCGIAGRNNLKTARDALIRRGWLEMEEDLSDRARPRRYYKLRIDDRASTAAATQVSESDSQGVSKTDTVVSEMDSEVSATDSVVSAADTRTYTRGSYKKIKKEDTAYGQALSSPPCSSTPAADLAADLAAGPAAGLAVEDPPRAVLDEPDRFIRWLQSVYKRAFPGVRLFDPLESERSIYGTFRKQLLYGNRWKLETIRRWVQWYLGRLSESAPKELPKKLTVTGLKGSLIEFQSLLDHEEDRGREEAAVARQQNLLRQQQKRDEADSKQDRQQQEVSRIWNTLVAECQAVCPGVKAGCFEHKYPGDFIGFVKEIRKVDDPVATIREFARWYVAQPAHRVMPGSELRPYYDYYCCAYMRFLKAKQVGTEAVATQQAAVDAPVAVGSVD